MALNRIREYIRNSIFFKVISNKFFLASVFFVLWLTVLSPNTIGDWINDLHKVSEQKKQIDYYHESIQGIEERLVQLRSNSDSLEKFARERYYFHAPDEEVFIVEPEKAE